LDGSTSLSECGNGFPPCLPWGIQIDAVHRAGTPWDAVNFPVDTTLFVPINPSIDPDGTRLVAALALVHRFAGVAAR